MVIFGVHSLMILSLSVYNFVSQTSCLNVSYTLKLIHTTYYKQFIERFSLRKKLEEIFLWIIICFTRLCLYSQCNYCKLHEFENKLSSLKPILSLCLILLWSHNPLFAQCLLPWRVMWCYKFAIIYDFIVGWIWMRNQSLISSLNIWWFIWEQMRTLWFYFILLFGRWNKCHWGQY